MWFFFCGKPSLDERPTLTAFPPEENRMLDVVTLSLKRFFFGTYYPPAHSLLCFPFTGRIPPCCSGEDSPPEFTLENTCTVLVSSEKVVRKMFSTNAHSWHTHTHIFTQSLCPETHLWEFHKASKFFSLFCPRCGFCHWIWRNCVCLKHCCPPRLQHWLSA